MAIAFHSIFGIVAFIGLAWLMSEHRRAFPWRIVAAGLGLQLVLAVLLLYLPASREFFVWLNDALLSLMEATEAGTAFVFGYLGGGDPPFEETGPGSNFILAFRALPLVLVISALSSLLFYLRILPALIRGFAALLRRGLGIGGALGVGTAANVFIGMVESPLLIRPYLKQMSRGELFALMTCGMATIAGTMMVLYASIVGTVISDAMGHILTASLLSAPAAVLVAAVMIPPTGPATAGSLSPGSDASGPMDAITRGTLQGLELLLHIVAMLIVLVALVSLVNIMLGVLPQVGDEPITLQRLLGYVMAPLVWLMGVPWAEAHTAGALMGTKTIINEFVAYMALADLPEDALSPRSSLLLVYAMCGFANLGSLGIMIGGLGTMVPERRQEVVELGIRSIVAGTLATLMTGAMVGVLIHDAVMPAGTVQ